MINCSIQVLSLLHREYFGGLSTNEIYILRTTSLFFVNCHRLQKDFSLITFLGVQSQNVIIPINYNTTKTGFNMQYLVKQTQIVCSSLSNARNTCTKMKQLTRNILDQMIHVIHIIFLKTRQPVMNGFLKMVTELQSKR